MAPRPFLATGAAGEHIFVSVVTSGLSSALLDLFGRAGASNGCWCRYWLIGPEYHRRDRTLNRAALVDEVDRADPPGPGLLAQAPDGTPIGWARLTPRSELTWLLTRFGKQLPVDDGVWSMPCFFVPTTWHGRGVMSALISAGIDIAARYHLPGLEAYPIDPDVEGATRNRFPGVLRPFLRAGFNEVGRLSDERAAVRYQP